MFMYKTLKDYWGNSPLISSDIDDDKSKGSIDDSDVELPNERTSLNRQGTVVMTPSQAARRGFSAGFVNFFESRGGMVFGFANLALYYASAIFAFSFYFEPDWTVIDAIYFATVTFTTIGYGDITPSNDPSRLFTVFFSLYGIFILGFFAGILGEKVVEAHNAAVAAVEERGRQRVKEMFGSIASSSSRGILGALPTGTPTIGPSKRRTVLTLVCEVLQVELPLICLILFMGVCYGVLVEKWSVIQSIYYATITASTVGYGDLSPTEQWSRLLCIVFLPLAVTVFCEVLGRVAGAYLDYKIEAEEEKFLSRQLTLSDINEMDSNNDGNVMWGEFLGFMLTAMQKVDKEDIDHLRKVFDQLDITGTGQLNKYDIQGIIRERTQRHLNTKDLD